MPTFSLDQAYGPAQGVNQIGSSVAEPPPLLKRPAEPSAKTFSLDEAYKQAPTTPAIDMQAVGGFMKSLGGEAGAISDFVLSLPGFTLGTAAGVGASAIGLATGEKPKAAYSEGLAIGTKVTEALSNPVQKVLRMIHAEKPYEESKTSAVMQKFTSLVEDAGTWVEKTTKGQIPKEAVQQFLNTAMISVGSRAPEAIRLRGKPGEIAPEPRVEPTETPPPRPPAAALGMDNAHYGNAVWLDTTAQATAPKPRIKAKLRPEVEAPAKPVEAAAEPLPSRADKGAVRAWAEKQGLSVKDAYKRIGELKAAAPKIAAGAIVAGSAADYTLNPEHRQRYEQALGIGGVGLAAALAVKPKGGMWHPEAVERLSEPLSQKLEQLPDGTHLFDTHTAELRPEHRILREWPTKAVRNYLNKYAGTAEDPLRDVEIPFGQETKAWGDITDEVIKGKQVTGPKGPETQWTATAVHGMAGYRPAAMGAITGYLSHVGDYLREHVAPEKLQQYDLVRAVKETAKWDKELAAKMNSVEGRLEGTTPYKQYPDGFQWVEVKSADALKREGDVMGHCVGGYCNMVDNGEAIIYSLRDPKGASHVTIEVTPPGRYGGGAAPIQEVKLPQIDQIKGKQNRAPNPEYLPYVQDFVRSGKWGEVGDLANADLREASEVRRTAEQHGETAVLDLLAKYEGQRYVPRSEILKARGVREAGFADPKLLAKIAAIGGGAALGMYLDPEDKVAAAILGALGGAALSAVRPGKFVEGIKNLAARDQRVRIDHLADANEYTIRRAALDVWQLQNQVLDLVPQADRRAALSHYLEGDKSIVLSPKETQAANLARQYFLAMRKAGLESGVLKGAVENYVTHLWQVGAQDVGAVEKALQAQRGGRVSPFTPFGRERLFKGTLAEGKAAGMKPRTEDLAQILGIYGNSVARAIANKRMIESLKAANAPDGVPLIQRAGKAPSNYVGINHPQMQGYRVHPDIAPSMRFIFDNHQPGMLMKGLEMMNVAAKRSVVSFSLFHAKALLDAVIGASRSPFKALKYFGTAAAGTNEYLNMLKHSKAGDLVDKAMRDGVMFSLERNVPAVEDVHGGFYTGLESLQNFMDRAIPGAGQLPRAYAALNHMVDKFMWARLHAGMKLSLYSEKLEVLTEANARAHARDPRIPLRSEEELGKMAASYANDILGGLNWRRIAEESRTRWGRDLSLASFSPTGRRGLQLLMFAPDWTLSTTRAAAKAFGKGTGVRGLVSPQTVADLHRQFVIRSAIYYIAVGDGINYALSGHHIWQNKDPTTVDMGDGRTMQWSKHTMEPVHWLTKPGQQALNKLGVLPSELLSQTLGTEYLSAAGHAPRMKGRVAHLAKRFEPITGESFEAGGVPAGIASFLGAPIYGKTTAERERERERKRLERTMK